MIVRWYVQGEDVEMTSKVTSASDFLQSLKLVDVVSLESEEYQVLSTEIVVDDEPYLVVLLDVMMGERGDENNGVNQG